MNLPGVEYSKLKLPITVAVLILLTVCLGVVYYQQTHMGIRSLYINAIDECDIPYVPQVCFNEQSTQYQFNNNTQYTYSIVCHYDEITLYNNTGSRQCFVNMWSILITRPRYGFTLLVPTTAVIHDTARELLNTVQAHIVLYEPIQLPDIAIALHNEQKRGWAVNYNKIYIWTLLQYSKVLNLDVDSIVLENLDHIFLLEDSAGCDCLPHGWSVDESQNDWKQGYSIGGLLLITPSNHTYTALLQQIEYGVGTDSNHQPYWKWWQSEQQLINEYLHLPHNLPGNLQYFPDICWISTDPVLYFPLHRAYIIHYTNWGGHHAYEDRRSDMSLCETQFYDIYQHFDYTFNDKLLSTRITR